MSKEAGSRQLSHLLKYYPISLIYTHKDVSLTININSFWTDIVS